MFLSLSSVMQQFITKGIKNEKSYDTIIPYQSDMKYYHSFIHIDDNWTETAENYDWCNGSGSWNDPFLIENVNIFINASIAGIFINNSQNVYFVIRNCTLSNNSTKLFSAGIRLENTNNGKIMNISSNSNSIGILFINTYNTSIEVSDLRSNNYGICLLQSSSGNSIYQNNILNNTVQGVNITNCNDNNVYYNNFYNNTINAVDSGINNVWNKEDQGNYWDDYVGKDKNDDGIGDTPYLILGSTGSQDNFPIWWDAPDIKTISPLPYSLHGSLPLNFSVSLDEGLPHTWWYTIDIDPAKNHFITNGSINEIIWGLLENGSHTFFFCVNDSRGYEDCKAITIYKDIETPSIDIIYPKKYLVFGYDACNFSIIILESNLNSTWYTLNNGNVTYFDGIHGQNHGIISQDEWKLQPNGTVLINFFANDTMGNLGKSNVTVYKDIISPSIIINEPFQHEVFGISPPMCNVTFYDVNGVNKTWYYLTNGTTITPEREWTGNIQPNDWNAMPNGTLTIIFIANDTVGNIGTANVSIYKDIIGPDIFINEPRHHDLFSIIPPICDVTFDDINRVNTSWYQLTNSTFTTVSRTWTGSIDINDWNMMGNGTVNIIFFANDSLGNINSNNVLVFKDIISPYIAINEPKPHEVFGQVPPECNLTLYDIHFIDDVWYKLTNGTITTNTRMWTDFIHIDDWNAMGNGSVTIIFYANDTLGNLANMNVSVYKDIIAPTIIINDPNPYEVFGTNTPICLVSFDDINGISAKWYQLTDGITTTTIRSWNENIFIDDWNAMVNGTVTIIFYANDTLGNLATANVTVYKDIIAPLISITEPLLYEVFGTNPPSCLVSFDDINGISTKWYQLTDGITTTTIRPWNDNIHLDDWNVMNNGTITIIFYANDTLGNIANVNVSVYKDIIGPTIIINSPKPYEVYGKTVPTCSVNFYDIHGIDSRWYQLTNLTFTTASRTWTGSIDINDWNMIGNGTVFIMFFANDTFNNINSVNVSIYKDIISPVIIINDPQEGELFGFTPPIIDLNVTDPHLETIIYQLTNGSIPPIIREWEGYIYQEDWDQIGNGTITITFIAFDSLNNFASRSLFLRKNIFDPIVIIADPIDNELFGINPPNITLYISSAATDTIWYRLYNTTYTTNNMTWGGTIDSAAWEIFRDGSLSIQFYINDTLGNLGFDIVSLRKDITAPSLSINSPLPFTLFGTSSPEVLISYFDQNSISSISYQLQNEVLTTPLRTWTETIISADWNVMGNGTVIIIFRAEDVVGNIAFANVTVRKDIIAPEIVIYYPNVDGELYGYERPIIYFFINEGSSVSELSYQLINDTFSSSIIEWIGSIDQMLWDQFGNGTITIYFYATDLVGNEGTASIMVRKDIIAPSISIVSPAQYQKVGRDSPFFEVYITDGNLFSCWYTIIGTNVNKSFSGSFGRINQTLWESVWDNIAVDDTIIIRFYAQDKMKNLNYNELLLVKYITPGPDVPTPFPIDLTDLIFLGCLGAVAITLPLIIKKSRVYGSGDSKQKKVLQRTVLLTIVLLILISVAIIII